MAAGRRRVSNRRLVVYRGRRRVCGGGEAAICLVLVTDSMAVALYLPVYIYVYMSGKGNK
jgi:hypothetical protein